MPSRRRRTEQEEAIEKPIALNQLRLEAVMQAVTESGAKRVLDLGCGEGKLIRELLKDRDSSKRLSEWTFHTAVLN